MPIKPWVRGPFDLLRHGEEHRQGTRDFDRRMALISFDNAIEMAVVTYLDLNPAQRNQQTYTQTDVAHWKRNFHTKLEFIEAFAVSQGSPIIVQREDMIYYHSLRNDLYHGGNGTVPTLHAVDGARSAALWVISLLFDVNAETLLRDGEDLMPVSSQPPSPETEFLEQFIDVKKILNEVLTFLHASVNADSSLYERIRAVTPNFHLQAAVAQVTTEAELIKQRLVDGEPTGVSDSELRSLTEQLGSLSVHFREHLHAYQLDIIEAAFEATLRKQPTGGIAGMIQQAVGTGITSSVIGYLARCRESNELGSLPQIVLVDRLVMAEQLINSIQKLPDNGALLEVSQPDSRQEMRRLLMDDRPRLIVATQQLVSSLETQVSHACLVVNLSAASGGLSPMSWLPLFPRGIFIAFGGPQAGLAEGPWTPLIAEYNFQQAVFDSHLRSVVIEQRDWLGVEGVLRSDNGVSDAMIAVVVEKILEDFIARVRRRVFRKGIVVTNSGLMVQRLSQMFTSSHAAMALRDLKLHAWEPTMAPNHLERMWQIFQNDGAPQLLVSTYHRLTGIDPGSEVAYYVACTLPVPLQLRIAAMAGRPSPDASANGAIIDLAGNVWTEHLSEFTRVS